MVMKAYLLLDLTIHDLPGFMQYVEQIPALIAKHGGHYIVRGMEPEAIEGDWQPERVVIIAFPSRQHAQNFLKDPQAQALFTVRHQTTTSKLLLVDSGID